MDLTAAPVPGRPAATAPAAVPPLSVPVLPEPPGARIDAPSLVVLAAEAIRKMILSGALAPGERLIEERLTEHLGISRPPLREALRLLQNDRLVVTRPRHGSAVATLTDQDVFEILTLRAGLERMAVELGVPVRDRSRLTACHEALERM